MKGWLLTSEIVPRWGLVLLFGMLWGLLTLVLIEHANDTHRERVIQQLEHRLRQHERPPPKVVPRGAVT